MAVPPLSYAAVQRDVNRMDQIVAQAKQTYLSLTKPQLRQLFKQLHAFSDQIWNYEQTLGEVEVRYDSHLGKQYLAGRLDLKLAERMEVVSERITTLKNRILTRYEAGGYQPPPPPPPKSCWTAFCTGIQRLVASL